MRVRAYEPRDEAAWDARVGGWPDATVLSTRRFLGYHGDRFEDASLLVEDDGAGGRLVAALAAARVSAEHVVSHPGATFGGVLGERPGDSAFYEAVLAAMAAHYRERGVRRLTIRLAPAHLFEQPDEAQLHALIRLGARVERMDLWSVIELDRAHAIKPAARRAAKKADKLGLSAGFESDRPEPYVEYHALLSENLRARHGVSPVHSAEELLTLRRRLGDDQALFLSRDATGALLAGVFILCHRPGVMHTQYIASSDAARDARALDHLFVALHDHALERGARVLSFGASTESAGMVLNEPLHRFKSKFGGGARVQHHVRWDL